MKTYILTAIAVIALTACDQIGQKLGLEDPAKKEAQAWPHKPPATKPWPTNYVKSSATPER